MVLVIYWSIADVVYVLYMRLSAPPYFLLDVEDILQVFGAFMIVSRLAHNPSRVSCGNGTDGGCTKNYSVRS
jgi:hypothetical protein